MQQNQTQQISKKERRNILVFIFLILIMVFIPRILLYRSSLTLDDQVIAENREKFQSFTRTISDKKFRGFSEDKRRKYLPPVCRFNPNDYRFEDWIKLGLSEKQAKAVLKFTRYGVYSHDQLKRIFVIPDELYTLIKDSVWFPEKKWVSRTSHFSHTSSSPTFKSPSIEINHANEEDLKRIKGIGPFFAKQIIRLRDKLGGFIAKEQLLEVWKMNDSTFQCLIASCYVNPDQILQLSINSATVEQLKQHPYIGWHIANSIVKMRIQSGPFRSIEQLKKSKLISDETFEKMKPYLTL